MSMSIFGWLFASWKFGLFQCHPPPASGWSGAVSTHLTGTLFCCSGGIDTSKPKSDPKIQERDGKGWKGNNSDIIYCKKTESKLWNVFQTLFSENIDNYSYKSEVHVALISAVAMWFFFWMNFVRPYQTHVANPWCIAAEPFECPVHWCFSPLCQTAVRMWGCWPWKIWV